MGQPQSNGAYTPTARRASSRTKSPRSVDIVTDLAKNLQDKILKRELRERYWQGLERRV
jgi:acyl-CoA synthetase (AMP-forming)/AMP-acid ligase II